MAKEKQEKTVTTKTATKKAVTKKVAPKADKLAAKTVKVKTETKTAPKVVSSVYVLEINNMQYVAEIGQIINVKVSPTAEPKDVTVNVLAVVDLEKKSFDYGKPYLKLKAEFELLEVIKTKKVFSATFKSKARQRRKVGSRAKYREFKLVSIK